MSEEDVMTLQNDEVYQQVHARRQAAEDRARPHIQQSSHQPEELMPYQRLAARLTNDNINAISGALAGVTAGVVVCPLDVAKTRLQAQGGFNAFLRSKDPSRGPIKQKYSGVGGTLSVIWKDEGIRGLYRGLVPIVIGYIPTWTVYFMLYEKSKRFIATHITDGDTDVSHILSALIAGGSSTLVTNPIWVVKTRLMSQNAHSSWHYSGTFDAFRTMYRQEGIRVFYSGICSALLGLSHVAIQFPIYERLKSSLIGSEQGRPEWQNNLGILAASGLSKVCASTITYPHEVIRTRNQIQWGSRGERLTRQQVPRSGPGAGSGAVPESASELKYRGVIRTARIILAEEGWRAFYAGLGTNMVRAVPSSAVTLFTYEFISRRLRHVRDRSQVL